MDPNRGQSGVEVLVRDPREMQPVEQGEGNLGRSGKHGCSSAIKTEKRKMRKRVLL